MTPGDVVRVINAGSVAVGLGLLLAPRLSARAWIGAYGRRPGDALLAAIGLAGQLWAAPRLVDEPPVA